MSIENVKKFYALAEMDNQLKSEIERISGQGQNKEIHDLIENDILPLAKNRGLNFSADEMMDYLNQQINNLSADELMNVSGGISQRGAALGLSGVLLLSLGVGGATQLFKNQDVPSESSETVVSSNDSSEKESKADNAAADRHKEILKKALSFEKNNKKPGGSGEVLNLGNTSTEQKATFSSGDWMLDLDDDEKGILEDEYKKIKPTGLHVSWSNSAVDEREIAEKQKERAIAREKREQNEKDLERENLIGEFFERAESEAEERKAEEEKEEASEKREERRIEEWNEKHPGEPYNTAIAAKERREEGKGEPGVADFVVGTKFYQEKVKPTVDATGERIKPVVNAVESGVDSVVNAATDFATNLKNSTLGRTVSKAGSQVSEIATSAKNYLGETFPGKPPKEETFREKVARERGEDDLDGNPLSGNASSSDEKNATQTDSKVRLEKNSDTGSGEDKATVKSTLSTDQLKNLKTPGGATNLGKDVPTAEEIHGIRPDGAGSSETSGDTHEDNRPETPKSLWQKAKDFIGGYADRTDDNAPEPKSKVERPKATNETENAERDNRRTPTDDQSTVIVRSATDVDSDNSETEDEVESQEGTNATGNEERDNRRTPPDDQSTGNARSATDIAEEAEDYFETLGTDL